MHLDLTAWLPFNVSLRARDSIKGNSFLLGIWARSFLNVRRYAPIFDEWRTDLYLPINRESMHVCMQLSRELIRECWIAMRNIAFPVNAYYIMY